MSKLKSQMRIVVITQGISRIVHPLLQSDYEIIGFIESASRNNKSKKYNFLKSIYYQMKHISLKAIAKENNIPYRLMSSSNDSELVDWIKKMKPDLIVVHSMSQLLKEDIFTIPKLGTINIHPSLLPKYRGPNPDFWQYYDLEMSPGITVHYIDKGEDTGDILNQDRLDISLGEKSPERLDKLVGGLGIKLLLKTLDELSLGIAKPIVQPKESPTSRARNIRPEEHEKLIDWQNWQTSHIWHVLRGTELWLNAIEKPYGIYTGQRWIIGNYKLINGNSHKPGQVYKYKRNYYVATKDGVIELSVKFKLTRLLTSTLKTQMKSDR